MKKEFISDIHSVQDNRAYFTVSEQEGINYFYLREGNWEVKNLCPYFKLKAVAHSTDEDRDYLIINNEEGRQIIFAKRDLGTKSGFKELRELITLPPETKSLNLIINHINEEINRLIQNKARLLKKSGWSKDENAVSYIYPNGEVISLNGEKEEVFFKGKNDKTKEAYSNPKGTLKSFQEEVIKYAVNNSRLTLAIGVSIFAPIMESLGIKGGCVHLFGNTGEGKSAALAVATAIYGQPDKACIDGGSSDPATAIHAQLRNNGFLPIDELSKMGKEGIRFFYAAGNGRTAEKATKEGELRESQFFSISSLSTGEKSIFELCKDFGVRINPGELMRIPSISLKYEDFYFATKEEFFAQIFDATANNYGVMGREWVKIILQNPQIADEIKENYASQLKFLLEDFKNPEKINFQLNRPIRFFVGVACAINIANKYGLFGDYKLDLSMLRKVFQEWLEEMIEETNGKAYERACLINKWQEFVITNQKRFTVLQSNGEVDEDNKQNLSNSDFIGYFRPIEGLKKKEIEFLQAQGFKESGELVLMPEPIFNKIFPKRAKDLAEEGYLITNPNYNGKTERNYAWRLSKLNLKYCKSSRLYVLRATLPEFEDDEEEIRAEHTET